MDARRAFQIRAALETPFPEDAAYKPYYRMEGFQLPEEFLDPLAANAEAAMEIFENARPPDSDGRTEQITDLAALERGRVTVRQHDEEPPSRPSPIFQGGDHTGDGHA